MSEWIKKIFFLSFILPSPSLRSFHPSFLSPFLSLSPHRNRHTETLEYYSGLKMKKILPFAITWMNVEGITLSEISQKEKDKSIYMWTVFFFFKKAVPIDPE